MKKIKFFFCFLMIVTLLSNATFAASKFPKARDWAVPELEKAVEYGLIREKTYDDYLKETTREEFCKLAVGLYEKLMGKLPALPTKNPFTDTKDEMILRAYQAGIVSGTSTTIPTTFLPKNKVTRQEQAKMIENLIKSCGYNTNLSKESKEFADQKAVDVWFQDAVRFARKAGVMQGDEGNRVNPKANIKRDESVLLIKRTYEVYTGKDMKITVNANEIGIGDIEASVTKKLGQPQVIEQSGYGFDWYIYNLNSINYVQIGVKDGKVVATFSNGKNVYHSVLGQGSKWSEAKKIFKIGTAEVNRYSTTSNGVIKTIYFDKGNEYTVLGILQMSSTLMKTPGITGESIAANERVQVYLTNVERINKGLRKVESNEMLTKGAKAHSAEMALNSYLSHKNMAGEEPFQRAERNQIRFMSMGENIAQAYDSAIEAHMAWMNSNVYKNNILSNEFNGIGVGISNQGNTLYYVLDFIEE